MNRKDAPLLEELVASSDSPQTLRAQLVDATVARPQALQEIQRTVMVARNSGELDDAVATRILFQVDLLVETTKVLGLDSTRPARGVAADAEPNRRHADARAAGVDRCDPAA